jgi:tRNA (cytidine32/uridine32-2'-O)-methyltransferase
MAVQVLCYELRMTSLARFETATDASTSLTGPSSDGWDAGVASHSDVNGVIEHFEAVALNTGFLDPEVPGLVIPRLRRLFQRAELDKMEVNILRGILTSIQKRI